MKRGFSVAFLACVILPCSLSASRLLSYQEQSGEAELALIRMAGVFPANDSYAPSPQDEARAVPEQFSGDPRAVADAPASIVLASDTLGRAARARSAGALPTGASCTGATCAEFRLLMPRGPLPVSGAGAIGPPRTRKASEQRIATAQGVNSARLAAVVATVAAANTGIFMMEKERWWNVPGVRFHFKTERGYARNFDKLGHFLGTDLHAVLIARSFEWSGVSPRRAALLGSVIGLAMQTHVEINDGFYPMWGFDLLDQTANTLGATWFYLHETSETLARFDTRWSYWSRPIRKPARSFSDEAINSFTSNYNGQGYWVAARIHDLLPETVQSWWPRALMVSAGVYLDHWVGVDLADELRRPQMPGHVSGYLSLDLDWDVILPQGTHRSRFLSDLLNRTHLPAPAIRLAPRPRLFLLFHGQ